MAITLEPSQMNVRNGSYVSQSKRKQTVCFNKHHFPVAHCEQSNACYSLNNMVVSCCYVIDKWMEGERYLFSDF